MPIFFGISLSAWQIILFILVTAISAIVVFLGWIWYFSLDRRTRSYDKQLQNDIRKNKAFSGIRDAARPEFIVTSDTRFSKFIGRIRKMAGFRSEKPYKIVPYDDDVIEPRKIESIRRRVRNIPGRDILGEDLVGAIRNQYAYKLALNREGVGNDVVEYFRTNLEAYEAAQKVLDLAKSDNYDKVTLISTDGNSANKDPLNDVFLPLVSAAENHCVGPAPDLEAKQKEIEHCREVLKLSLHLLWTHRMKGVEVSRSLDEDTCLQKYRDDVKNADNWAYWMISSEICEDGEFRRLRHIAWSIKNILNEHWDTGTHSELYPWGDSVKDMEYAERPFAIFHKRADEIHGGGGRREN